MNKRRKNPLLKTIRADWQLYLLIIPGLLYLIIFKYWPMYGISIAFKDYNVLKGVADSPWVGLENFTELIDMYGFLDSVKNTFLISFKKIGFGFMTGPILAILINELSGKRLKKIIQTVVVFPYFISWVVVSGLCYALFSPSVGVIGEIAQWFGYEGEVINLLTNQETFQGFLVGTAIWKTMGWGSIIYLSAISGIDPQLYEAAKIDGAGRLQQIWHVTLPGIRSTIIIMLILRLGTVLEAGFDQIYVLTNPLVNDAADIIDTYVYRIGIEQAKYHYGAAAGLFKSLVAMVLVFTVNTIARKIDPDSALW